MIELNFFDVNCAIGRQGTFRSQIPPDAKGLLDQMEYYGIKDALVYHAVARDYHPVVGNEKLTTEIDSYNSLKGCWVLLPTYTKEMPPPRVLVKDMLRKNIRAIRLFSTRHLFSLKDCKDLFGVLEEYRIPVILDFDITHICIDKTDWQEVREICIQYPSLPVIVVHFGLRSNRIFYPLLSEVNNLYLEISNYWICRGIEAITKEFGAERLLFGTNMPLYNPGCFIAMVSYANIPDKDKQLIAGDNLRNLFKGIKTNV